MLYDEINSVSFLFSAVIALYDHIFKVFLAPSLYALYILLSIGENCKTSVIYWNYTSFPFFALIKSNECSIISLPNPEQSGVSLMTNNERFNLLLNQCAQPRNVYHALLALAAKPSVQQAHDVREKGQVLVGEVVSLLDISQRNQKPV